MESPRSPEMARLEKFHADFVERHSSPSRQKFLVEFGRAGMPAHVLPAATKPLEEAKAPPMLTKFEGQRFETTNQFRYMPYTEALKLACFRPEVKHRYMKAET